MTAQAAAEADSVVLRNSRNRSLMARLLDHAPQFLRLRLCQALFLKKGGHKSGEGATEGFIHHGGALIAAHLFPLDLRGDGRRNPRSTSLRMRLKEVDFFQPKRSRHMRDRAVELTGSRDHTRSMSRYSASYSLYASISGPPFGFVERNLFRN